MKTQVSALVLALMVTGCVSLPSREMNAPDMPTWTVATDPSAEVVLDWWTRLNDPALDRVMDQALSRNADLRAADANLRAARALAGEAEAARGLFGQVDANVNRLRVAGLSQPPIPGTPERLPTQTLGSVSGTLAWETDLFGGLAAARDATRAQAEEALWLRRQTEAGVAAALVRAWADYRYSAAIEQKLMDRVSVQERILASLSTAHGLGGVSQYDVQAGAAALEQARAELPGVGAAKRNAARRLAVLSGTAPTDGATDGAVPVAPAGIAAGNPATMLRRRPDVAAAERQFSAAAARARVAVADLYPRISLTGNLGLSADPDRLGDAGAFGFAFGPSLSWGVFDLPRLRQRVIAADAQSEAALMQWEAKVLSALEETDGALDTWKSSRQAVASALEAASASERQLNLVEVRRQAGRASGLTRLQAEAETLTAQIAALRAQSSDFQAWTSAQLALGAGWRDVVTVAHSAQVNGGA